MAMSGDIADKEHDLDLDYFDDGPKMTRAEFIMAGMDLEPIESLYSQELRQLSVAQKLSTDNRKQTNESNIQSINRNVTGGIGSVDDYTDKTAERPLPHSTKADYPTN